MLTRTALAAVDAVLEKMKDAGAATRAAVCMQAACVRALVDEVESYPPSNNTFVLLQNQLADEVDRLLGLVDPY